MRQPARGHPYRNQLRVVVSFDPETFNQIQMLAIKDRVSFGEMVRQLTEWGLMEVAA